MDIASESNIKQLIMDFRFASFSKFAKSNLFAAQDFKHFEPEVSLHEAEARSVATSEVKLLHSLFMPDACNFFLPSHSNGPTEPCLLVVSSLGA